MKLNHCPFCGSTHVAVVSLAVHCGSCASVGPSAPTQEQAASRWNQRLAPSQQEASNVSGKEKPKDDVVLNSRD